MRIWHKHFTSRKDGQIEKCCQNNEPPILKKIMLDDFNLTLFSKINNNKNKKTTSVTGKCIYILEVRENHKGNSKKK